MCLDCALVCDPLSLWYCSPPIRSVLCTLSSQVSNTVSSARAWVTRSTSSCPPTTPTTSRPPSRTRMPPPWSPSAPVLEPALRPSYKVGPVAIAPPYSYTDRFGVQVALVNSVVCMTAPPSFWFVSVASRLFCIYLYILCKHIDSQSVWYGRLSCASKKLDHILFLFESIMKDKYMCSSPNKHTLLAEKHLM